MTFGIYTITNIINKKYYLGSSKNIEQRWKIHRSSLKHNKHINVYLQRAWNDGKPEDFSFDIILNCDGYTKNELFAIEQFFLDQLDIGKSSYNLSKKASGGDLISYHPNHEKIVEKIREAIIVRYENMSEEDREQMSLKTSGEKNPMYGKTHSEEARKNISEKGKITRGDAPNYRKDKTFEEIFGEEEAARLRNILSESASKRVGDKNPFFGKKHTEKLIEEMSERQKGKYNGDQNKPIIIDGIIYRSSGEASKILNIPAITIRWRVLSKNKKFKNYKYYKE